MKYKTKQVIVNAYTITNVSPMTDDGGRDITIDKEGHECMRHAQPQMLRLYEPTIGDYWVENGGVAMPWKKVEFENRHTKEES